LPEPPLCIYVYPETVTGITLTGVVRNVKEKIKVFIVDDSQDYVFLLEKCLKAVSKFELIGRAYDGETAVQQIIALEPDIVIMDIIIRKKDGIAVLEELQNTNGFQKPVIIILTAINLEKYIKKALSLGAQYYILKPYNIKTLPKKIMQVYQDSLTGDAVYIPHKQTGDKSFHIRRKKIRDQSLREFAKADVVKALRDIGVPEHLSGYLYLHMAILETVLSEKGIIPLTKELYPMIARHFNTSPGKVERTIRCTIQKVWQRADRQEMSRFFTHTHAHNGIYPTNSEFIAAVADKIRLMYSAG
jgi:two-component system response regulator (stage 0 sporulation protein A)